jgi:hypothetical protein
VKESSSKAHARTVLEQQQKNQSYQLLSDDDEDDDGPEKFIKPSKVTFELYLLKLFSIIY